jgi:restriction system protein
LVLADFAASLYPVTEKPQIPRHTDLLWPTLQAVREIGDSGTIEEIVEKVIATEGFTDDQLAVPSKDGRRGLIEYRLAWARSYLKGMGLLENSQRGVWSTTELGRTTAAAEIPALHAAYTAQAREAKRAKRAAREDDDLPEPPGEHDLEASTEWKEKLLSILLAVSSDQFERLARRLLREAGFVSATVTGKSGDGGIDGIGVYRVSLLSFPVFFQCKRYSGSVGSGAVRDFRGAMSGRGEKGLLITTGTYTTDAKHEATRDGAPPVDLIDGDQLCDLLKSYELGVRCTLRQTEDVAVDSGFFTGL